LGLSAHMVLNLLYEWNVFANGVDYSFGWASLYGPSFYFYIRALSLRPIRLAAGCLHLLPFVLINLLNLVGLSGNWLAPLISIQLIAYLLVTALFIKNAYRSLPEIHSEPTVALMAHTKTMLALFFTLLVYDTWARSQPSNPVFLGLSFAEITLFGVLFLINLMFLRQITVPAADPLPSVSSTQSKAINDPVSAADPAEADQLKSLTLAKSLHLTPNLTLARLAKATGFSEKRCSEILNNQLNTNFSDFINLLRVEACKSALLSQTDTNVLDIGLAHGFNSKTAFNTAFKKFTGQSPTQFRKYKRSDISI